MALIEWPNNAGFVGEDDCLDAVAEVELGEDVRDVGFDGVLAQHELGCDLRVGAAWCDEAKDLEFTPAELVEIKSWRAGSSRGEHRSRAADTIEGSRERVTDV